jgi:carboxypeptidase family protein
MHIRTGFPTGTLTGDARSLRRVVLVALACLATPVRLATAQAPAVLSGRVVDRASAASVVGATVSLIGTTRTVATDSVGRFRFDAFPVGSSRILVRSFPYRPFELTVTASSNDIVRVTIELDSSGAKAEPRNLPAVTVSAEPQASNYRLTDFNRRRITGRGQYLTDEQITRSGAASLSDATRGMRGVEMTCNGNEWCQIHMVRAPKNCSPQFVVDGRVDNMFGPTTPIRDIVGLEVYTGPSDVPGEFAGTSAGCGVIVMWTRSGAEPRRP